MAKRDPSGDDKELLDTPDQDEGFVEPTEEEEARRPERRRPWQEGARASAEEAQEETIEGKPEVPAETVARLDRGTAREETIEGEPDVPSDVVGRLDEGEGDDAEEAS